MKGRTYHIEEMFVTANIKVLPKLTYKREYNSSQYPNMFPLLVKTDKLIIKYKKIQR